MVGPFRCKTARHEVRRIPVVPFTLGEITAEQNVGRRIGQSSDGYVRQSRWTKVLEFNVYKTPDGPPISGMPH